MFSEPTPVRSQNFLDIVVESRGMKKSIKTPTTGGKASPIKTPAKGGDFGIIPVIQCMVRRVDQATYWSIFTLL